MKGRAQLNETQPRKKTRDQFFRLPEASVNQTGVGSDGEDHLSSARALLLAGSSRTCIGEGKGEAGRVEEDQRSEEWEERRAGKRSHYAVTWDHEYQRRRGGWQACVE